VNIAVFDTKRFERESLERANAKPGRGHSLTFFEPLLTARTAALAEGFPVVCVFVHDRLDAEAIGTLAKGGTKLVALRCAGFNNVDLKAAAEAGLRVVRVAEYSPYAVAEHAAALLMALNRKIPRAHARVRDGNFSLDGLVGFDLHGKTVGVVGTGKIGACFARIAHGFGCRLLGYDARVNGELVAQTGIEYVPLDRIYAEADAISLHVPLFKETFHLIGAAALAKMKPTAVIVNTSRGALIDAAALIDALKAKRIGGAALDVYEEEEHLFFRDLSNEVLQDDVLARLLTFPNVLITAHQAFLTEEALDAIAGTTLDNVAAFEAGREMAFELKGE